DSHRDPLQHFTLSEEADERQSRESREHREIERLVFEVLSPALDGLLLIGKIPRIVRLLSMDYLPDHQDQQNTANKDNRPLHSAVPCGVSIVRAMRLEPFRMARAELLMEIDARETAATSAPTLNGSRMSLPLNCWANSGRSTEK